MFFKRKNKLRQKALPEFSFCEANTEGLRSWVSVLPRRNIRAMVNQLIVAGKELTASNCQLNQLIAVLEILDEPIMTVSSGLLTQKIKDDHEVDIYRKRQEFFTLFGHIYCVAGQAQLNNKSAQQIDELLLKASHFLCNATIASYQLYESPPAGCWQLLHKIYQYSLTNSYTEANAVKFSASYKIVAALCCASPEKLNAKQIEVLAEYMRTAIVGVSICENPNNQTNFCVATNEDQQPRRYITKNLTTAKTDASNQNTNNNEPDNDSEKNITIESNKNVIYFDFHKIQSTLTSSCLSSDMAKHLNSSYGPPQVRAHTRIASTGVLEICSDLSAIHYFLSGEKTFDSFAHRFVTQYTTGSHTRHQTNKTKPNDVWNGIYASNWQQTEFDGNSIEFEIKNNHAKKTKNNTEFPVQRIAISDLNPSGYKLVGNDIALRAYKPGNLIGLKHTDESHWHVGIIRWSKAIKHDKQLGVELLTKQIQPYGIKIVHSKQGGDFMPALLLPVSTCHEQKNSASRNSASLLLPRLKLSGKTAAIMINARSKKHIVLGDCIEESGGYCRFLYTDQSVSESKKEARQG